MITDHTPQAKSKEAIATHYLCSGSVITSYQLHMISCSSMHGAHVSSMCEDIFGHRIYTFLTCFWPDFKASHTLPTILTDFFRNNRTFTPTSRLFHVKIAACTHVRTCDRT